MKVIGTREEVWRGEADHTRSGMRKADFIQNVRGRIVSRKRSEGAKSRFPNGPTRVSEPVRRESGFLQFLVPILGSLLGSILTPNNGSGLGPYRQHLETAASHIDAALRSGRIIPEQVTRAAATVAAQRGRGGGGLLSMLGIDSGFLKNIPLVGSILG